MTADARGEITRFKERRESTGKLPAPLVSNIVQLFNTDVADSLDPWASLTRLANGHKFRVFAMNPFTTDTQLAATQVDYIILAFMGLLAFENGKVFFAMHPQGSETFVRAANRLQLWCIDMSMEQLRRMIPSEEADGGAPVERNQDHADELCDLLRHMASGEQVDFDRMKALSPAEDRREPGVEAAPVVPNAPLPPVPVLAAAPRAAAAAMTQATQATSGEEEEAKRIRLRTLPDPTAADFDERAELKKRIILSMVKTGQNPYTLSKNRGTFANSGSPEEVEDAFKVAFLWCHHALLGEKGKMGARISMKKPPINHMDEVCQKLAAALTPGATNAQGKLKKDFSQESRVEMAGFDMEKFDACVELLKGKPGPQ